jgi:epoxyqueuosine reductase
VTTGVLMEWAKERGYRIAWGQPSLLDEVRTEMQQRLEAGELDRRVFDRSTSRFRYLGGVSLPEVRTVGVIALPRPAQLITFMMGSEPFEAVIPPTYTAYYATSSRVLSELAAATSTVGYGTAGLHAPLKLLAAKLGLVTYGRNNLTYVPEFGSYHQLVGFATDGEISPSAAPGTATGPLLSEHCRDCTACRQACPVGAIGDDSFVLHAGRCMTFWNESQDPWPEWLQRAHHNCLVGCLTCQKVCPQNTGRLQLERVKEHFCDEETAAILEGDGPKPVLDAVKAKLAAVGLPGYEVLIGRNLQALVASTGNSTRASQETRATLDCTQTALSG